MEINTAGRHPSTQDLVRHIERDRDMHSGLAYEIRQVADEALSRLPDSPELSAGLRKLLEAQDCFERASRDVR